MCSFTTNRMETTHDEETHAWMEADLEGELPPYEWQEQEMPEGKPVCYTPGVGFVIEGLM